MIHGVQVPNTLRCGILTRNVSCILFYLAGTRGKKKAKIMQTKGN